MSPSLSSVWPTSYNDETTQNKDKHMSKLALPTGTTIVMTDQSTCCQYIIFNLARLWRLTSVVVISSFIASEELNIIRKT